MQINSLRPSPSSLERNAPSQAARPSVAPAHASRIPSEPAPAKEEIGRAGLRAVDSDLNRQVAGAQQALDFLDQVGNHLQSLKGLLSGRLSDTGASWADGRINEHIKRFGALWEQRSVQSGGSLDGALGLVQPGEAQQGFRVRGLDKDALAHADRETLSFSVAGRRDLSAIVEPDQPLRATTRRLDQALMPAGVRVRLDAEGELRFSAAESAWPDVRDSFAVRGGGKRFPSGEFQRVALDPDPEAIRPQSWNAEGSENLRRTLQEVVTALDLVRRARSVVMEALAVASSRFEGEAGTVDSLWASAFVQDFGALGGQPDYRIFSEIAPALIAVSRQRVVSLLSLSQLPD